MFTRLACLGLSLNPVKEKERVSGKVSNINQRFVNSCLANSPSVYIYTVKLTSVSWSITFETTAPQNVTCLTQRMYRSMTAQQMSQNQPERSIRDFLSLRHLIHFVLAGANNRNVIITYRFPAAPVQANRDFFLY